jgi:serine protease Do
MSVRTKTSIAVIVTVAFMAGVFFAAFGANIMGVGDQIGTSSFAQQPTSPPVSIERSEAIGAATTLEDAFIEVAERINPTVVQIRAETVREAPSSPFQGSPFEQFFGNPGGDGEPEEFRSQGLGSGVFVRQDGYIATNYHVIDGADDLEVRTYDGRFFDAEVVGTDPGSDLAIIKIDAEERFDYIGFGDISDVRLGQWVMAFGSPLSADLGNTVTNGIVSGIGRTSDQISQTLNLFAAFIQTDAAINPGNSGGPLVNLRGELVGINSAILSRSGGSQGIGFSIPVDIVKNVTDQLIADGTVTRGYLGVNFGSISVSLAEALGVPRGAAQITAVLEGTAADQAGLEVADIVTEVDGVTLIDPNQLRTIIANKRPGETVRLRVQREDDVRNVTVTLGDRGEIDTAEAQPMMQQEEEDAAERLGLSLRDATPTSIRQLGINVPNDGVANGALVVNIDRGSLAYREAELRRGDIITEIDRQPIRDVDQFEEVYRSVAPGETFLVRVKRYARGGTDTTFITALTKPE